VTASGSASLPGPKFTPWRAFPADPADWFSPEEIAKARQYQHPLDVVRAIDWGIRLVLALAVIGTGLPGRALDGIGIHAWWARLGVLCVLISAFATITLLPAGVWRVLSYDRRWGFSTQTPKGYVADELKGLAIVSALLYAFGLPAWAVVRATSLWWLYAWGIFAVVTTTLGLLYPVAIAPLFNKYTPLGEGPLRAALLDVARLVRADISDILVEDSSRRTTKGNAYVSGLGRTRRVVLYDTMVGKPPAELRTVVAHEIGHWKLRHLAKTIPASIGLSFVTFALLGVILPDHRVLRFAHVHRLGDPVAFSLVVVGFPLLGQLTGLVQGWLTRSFEREADLFALRSTGDAASFVAAMRDLYTANLSDLAPSWWKRLSSTHPSAAERLAMGAAWANAIGRPAPAPS
jgi:STE24 endopeptidase